MQVSASLEGIGTIAMFCDDFSCQRMCHMNIKLWSGSRASSETKKSCVLRTPSSDNWFPRMEKFGRGSSDEALHLRPGACVWSRLGRVSQWTNPTGIIQKDIVLLFKFSIQGPSSSCTIESRSFLATYQLLLFTWKPRRYVGSCVFATNGAE